MTGQTTTGPGRRELREAAADWFVRMREPAPGDREAFERWLAQDPLHRDAYNRIGELFALGKGLAEEAVPQARPAAAPPRRRRLVAAGGLAMAALIAVGVRIAAPPPVAVVPAGRLPAARSELAFATPVGTIRSWRLVDGSKVTLDTDSALAVTFTPDARTLRLLRGRARFDVAHEARPFSVTAATGTVTAHGTLFDVRLDSDERVSVRLLRGAVDVALAPGPGRARASREQLRPGEQLMFDKAALTAPSPAPAPPDGRWPEAMLDCDRTTLAAILSAANRYSTRQIATGDPAIGALRVSGSFRIDDPEALARHLAALFDLRVTQDQDGRLLLQQS